MLLVDDHPANIMVAKGLLLSAGFIVETAENGQQAVECLKSGSAFDAVLMDVRMPVMDGYDATRIIREDAAFINLPIIAMTADAMPGDRARSLAAGMNDHLTKPIDVDDLYEKLLKWIPPKTRSPYVRAAAVPSQIKPLPDYAWLQKSLPGICVGDALKRMDNDLDLLIRLIDSFCQDLPQRLADLDRAEREGNLSNLIHHAHTVKGLAANAGADAISRTAARLEDAAKSGNDSTYRDLLDALNAEGNKILAQMEAFRQTGHAGEKPSQPVREENPADQDRPIRILLVDDNKDIRLIVPTFLKQIAHTLSTAENGEKAFEIFKSAAFDLVLMDMQMPVMDGYTATAKIREWEKSN